jgi:hypothetical protein
MLMRSVETHVGLTKKRLITVGEHYEDLSSLLKYEHCSHSDPALFESSSTPLQANKEALADALGNPMNMEQSFHV